MDAASSSQTLQSSGGDSSKSSKSSKLHVQDDKDHDFTKENVASPIDLECQIQQERITKILDEALYKTKMTVCLPKFVHEYLILSNTLSEQDLDDLLFIYEQYDNPLFSASLINMAAMEDIKAGDTSLKNRLNPELGHLIYILSNCPALKKNVEECVDKMKDDFFNYGAANAPMLEFLLELEQFRKVMVEQMGTSAAEELAEKIRIRKLEDSNNKLVARIQELQATLKREQDNFTILMADKKALIEQLEAEKQKADEAGKEILKKKVLDTNRQMVVMSRRHDVRNEVLKEEEVETREGYNNLLNRHLIEEKAQRTRRFKVETQLLSWLQKYDLEMTDKQYQVDDLGRKYEEEKQLVADLEVKIAEQEIEWAPLMKEREDEYHEEMTKKLKDFGIDHAARVIQTAWKTVLVNRTEKRKLRKLLKQVKKERERLQKIADAKELRERKEAEKLAKAKEKKKKEKE